ncbi:MAG: DUF5110 domain-containing protein, partial [Kiritimatiellae bacterium]|nr:DUF5110 domain-containing protein [Kiritimatiellia bacterium]
PSPLPFKLSDIRGSITSARTVIGIPCNEPGEEIYGFGLDPQAYQQKGLRKYLAVCAAVMGKTGASHGPVPFYLSTKGYGVYVDTARIPVVHTARLTTKAASSEQAQKIATSMEELYAPRPAQGRTEVIFEIPGNSCGVDVYVFAGPTIRESVQRYNLFSGGGAVPPLWGLGMKYRTYTKADKATAMNVAKAMRRMKIPCDMFGLEPGWQTHAYSCSLAWSDKRFPDHQAMLDELIADGYHINLWEHAYINPASPLYKPLLPHSGDFLVWGGLVVDFADPKASRIFADYHANELVKAGISGFKADECDNQPLTDCTPFNFPTSTIFPSGIDGEQMLQLYGTYYQRSIYSVFKERNQRTWSDVRATSALAAPLPFNLYSDAYSFDEYLRQLVNASFTGLLWSPEVRDAGSYEELMNRIALASFAPQMCLNIWYMQHPVWEQFNRKKNNANELLPEKEQQRIANRIAQIVNQRYSLIPYLYAGFQRYHTEGLPPVRSLLLDFPADKNLRNVDNEFMFGDNLLAAPLPGKSSAREVYLPEGCRWIEMKSGRIYAGGSKCTFKGAPGDVPLFVRENTLIPFAKPVQYIGKDTCFEITVKIYGDTPENFTLTEDDGVSFDFERGALNTLTLSWTEDKKGSVVKAGAYKGASRYNITGWEKVPLTQ